MQVIEAIKKIYPDIQGGFVYWQTKYDGSPHKNPIDGLIWENTEYEKPTWEQIFVQLDIIELKERQNLKIAIRKSYLLSTDWYIYREIDEPNSYPKEIKNKRALARQEINDIEACTTLIDLKQFSETF